MAKPLVLELDGNQVAFEIQKVDRAKLYGYKEVEMIDEAGQLCEMATLAEDGHTVIGRGGTGMGYLSADGQWCDKSQLQPVDLSGQPITPVASSYTAPVPLSQPTTAADYLQHSIRSIYALSTETSQSPLLDQVRQGAIFKFPYSYRGGLEADTAFLIANDQGDLFMAVGSTTAIDYIGLEQTAAVVEDEASQDEDEGDDMDFGMI